jgi:hypothetical protein
MKSLQTLRNIGEAQSSSNQYFQTKTATKPRHPILPAKSDTEN